MAYKLQYFTFTLGRNTEDVQYKVTVYGPERTGDIKRYNPRSRPSLNDMRNLVNMLQEGHITRVPNPTTTLLSSETCRIDTQPVTEKYRNIHVQAGNLSFAVVTVERGADLCWEVQVYVIKLLKYIRSGLNMSLDNPGYMFNIHVTIEERNDLDRDKKWRPWNEKDVQKIAKKFRELVKLREKSILGRMTLAKIAEQIIKKSNVIEHVAAAIEQRVAKAAEKEGAQAVKEGAEAVKEGAEAGAKAVKEGAEEVGMKIPVVSTILGVYFAAQRAKQGDWAGALAEVCSGVAANIPGVGTVVSMGIDAGLLVKDVTEALHNEREHKKLLEEDIQSLIGEQGIIREQLAVMLPESPIYGWGKDSYFDESDLANLEDIVQIKIGCGDLIDAIQVKYRSQIGAQHGGNGGGLHTFDLETEEKITMVSGTTAGGAISSLTFSTDLGRQQTFGKKSGEAFEFEMTNGSYLAAIKGYDAYSGGGEKYPGLAGNYQLLPAIGFIPKY